MKLKITDSKLQNIAGGIVQGMSGSPIIQDGKLIGALSHVSIKNLLRDMVVMPNLCMKIYKKNIIRTI